MTEKNEIKGKEPRKIIIEKDLNTNVVNYDITGFGKPIDMDTLWGFIDIECNPALIKQRIIAMINRQPSGGSNARKEASP